jgi:hypothetical protein
VLLGGGSGLSGRGFGGFLKGGHCEYWFCLN